MRGALVILTLLSAEIWAQTPGVITTLNPNLRINPGDVVPDGRGNLYVTDVPGSRVWFYPANGSPAVVAGTGARGSEGDCGPAVEATLTLPFNIAFDGVSKLYISTSYGLQMPTGYRVRVVDLATRLISTLIPNRFVANGTSTTFIEPRGLALDASGGLYVADRNHNRVLHRDRMGVITTIAGAGPFAFGGDSGPAARASLRNPSGIALDSYGNRYISDTFNHRIRRVVLRTGIITRLQAAARPGTAEMGAGRHRRGSTRRKDSRWMKAATSILPTPRTTVSGMCRRQRGSSRPSRAMASAALAATGRLPRRPCSIVHSVLPWISRALSM